RNDKSTSGHLVYIAKSEHGFWDPMPSVRFGQLSFYIPAVSERAALFGLPVPDLAEEQKRKGRRGNLSQSESGFAPSGFGYDSYSREPFEIGSVLRVTNEVLEAETRRLGAIGYIDVTSNGWTKHTLSQ